ncbi:hypothetical protein K6U06_14450 [Acidiferrimicrobium sp. IK]|uniref:hypothetical protein n=1 Tax=Acidiferrimicrobium sp. IK TaxID=2871700 RepID=UPI0021CB8149|nr:hypothetical protein [Acidiferrimicrobium sp. IK]MCU4185566.1 hypothetical protein [Acidiferrimicrobium sp. IK]
MTSKEPSQSEAPSGPGGSIADQLDSVSLEQALRDFEIANRRVMDLTQRLIDVTEDRRALKTELELLRLEHRDLLAANHHNATELQALRASRGYMVIRAARAARRLASR